MKSIVRLKFAVLTSVGLISFLSDCLSEPYFSSMANITPVKLFHIHSRNASSNTRREDSSFGSVAKISRVIPIKHVTKLFYTNFGNGSAANVNFATNSSATKKKPTARLEYRSNVTADSNSKLPVNTHTSSISNTQLQRFITSTSTTVIPHISNSPSTKTHTPKPTNPTNKSPLFLTSDSWNYLNSAVTDTELRQIINGFSNDLIQNVTNITKHDPVAGQNFLLTSIIHELSKIKRSRMLPYVDEKKNVRFVNKGVRFSAKHRKPILNVVPLEQKLKLGKPVKNLIKTGLVEQWNISGLISNTDANDKKDNKVEQTENFKENGNSANAVFKASPIYPGSTTPTLMQVLAAPDKSSLDSTTFSPFTPNKLKDGFVPVNPFTSVSENDKVKASSRYRESKGSEEDDLSTKENIINSEESTLITRKPREPPKEDEYSIPSITTSSTSTPEVNKGYQTITESTTPGPKVIWYNHNQTPEDTFYPNTDPFLVPPEESSIEILADLLSVQPLPDENLSLDTKSFSHESSESSYIKHKNKIKGDRKVRPVLHHNSRENEDTIGSQTNWGSTLERNRKGNSKSNKALALQPAASTDHDGIRDYYHHEDVDGKNGGSSGINIYHDKKRYGAASHNGYDFKHHEIIPRHKKTNRKPPFRLDDTENYEAFNEDNHYQSSYPLPPGANRHESGPHRYRSYQHHDSPGEEEPVRIYEGGGSPQRYKEEEPSSDSDIYYPREPKYRPKESSPAYHAQSHYGWKPPSKDFFAKAKDYFKTSDFSTAEHWFDATIGILAFLAFGGYIIMLLYQVFAVSSGSSIGTLLGRGMRGAGEIFDLFFSKGPIGEAYLDELETIVKRAMANVKRIWKDTSFADRMVPKAKGEEMDEK